MRPFFTLFMVFLLIIRGLLGEAMAMGVSPHFSAEPVQVEHVLQRMQVHGEQTVMVSAAHEKREAVVNAFASSLVSAQDGIHHQHGETIAQLQPSSLSVMEHCDVEAAETGDTSLSSEGCGSQYDGIHHCTACGICHSTLSQISWNSLPLSTLAQALRGYGRADFVSAQSGPISKPPIF